jgi:hypothetical protein
LALITAVAYGASRPVRFLPDSLPQGRGTDVQIDTNPTRLTGRNETPNSIAFLLPSGSRFDRHAVAHECGPAKAAAARCPRVARIGFGHVVVHVSGYLFPGGKTDGVAYMTAFLAPPTVAGDKGSLVLEVQWVGADQMIATANKYFGTHIKRKSSVIGRIIPLRSSPFGLEVAFNSMPGGIQVPPSFQQAGVNATIKRFKLILGRVRRVRKPVTRVITVGSSTVTVHDHVLVGHHLISRPASCPGSRKWPWQLRFSFPQGEQRITGAVGCH